MSAVMSTLSMISGGRRAHRKLASSRKSGQFSDAGDERGRGQHDLNKQQRSASLQTLEPGGVVNLESLEAKMASIEVSLSGAGSRRRSAGARDASRELDALRAALADKDTLIQSLLPGVSLSGAGSRRRSAGARDASRELDALRAALADKDTLIQSLKKQLGASLSAARLAAHASSPAPGREDAALSPDERRALEERAAAVRAELDARRANILELKRRLDKTHVTENIDTRIEQAELQYQVGREELELLTLGEQARALALLIEQADAAHRTTLYSTVRECGGNAVVVAAEARESAWRAAPRGPGAAVDWSEHPAVKPGDRILEVNGTSTLCCSPEELRRAAASAAPARLVLLRAQGAAPAQLALTQNEAASLRAELGALRAAADDAERAKEGLRADNTRLTHRISYLEEQVAELLNRHPQLQPVSSNDSCITVSKTKKNVTSISITSEPQHKPSPKSEVQVFQKGPDITAIVAKLPGLDGAEANLPVMRPRSNASGASSRVATSPRASPTPNRRSHSSHSLEHRAGRMRHSLSHHCIHDYSAETDAAIRMIERNQRHMEKQRLKTDRLSRSRTEDNFRSDSDLDKDPQYKEEPTACDQRRSEIKKAAERIEESIKKTNWAERKTMSIIEQLKRSQRLRKMKKNESAENIQVESERHYSYNRIDGKVLENAHKSSRRSSKLHSRSAKSSEFESECSDYPNGDVYSSSPRLDYGSENCSRLSHYVKNEDREELKRPTPPRKPMRLSLHKAKSAHSLMNGSETESTCRAPPDTPNGDTGQISHCKRPVKRTHANDKWARERIRDGGRATPRPARKVLNGLSACETPAADDLYPESVHVTSRMNGKWC